MPQSKKPRQKRAKTRQPQSSFPGGGTDAGWTNLKGSGQKKATQSPGARLRARAQIRQPMKRS